MFLWFKFIWKVGSLLLGEIEGYIDIVPLDFGAAKKGGFGALKDIKFALGLSIKPHIFNLAMEIVEIVVKAIIRVIMIPFLYIVQGLQIVLEYCIELVESAQKTVRGAQRSLVGMRNRLL